MGSIGKQGEIEPSNNRPKRRKCVLGRYCVRLPKERQNCAEPSRTDKVRTRRT